MVERHVSKARARLMNGTSQRAGRKHRVFIAAVAVLAVVGGSVVSSPVASQDTANNGAGQGPAGVTLTVGGGASGAEWSGCSSEHCRHLTISLEGAPAGIYDIECWSSRDGTPWYSGRWRWPSSSLWTEGGCWFGYPGEQVWVIVGGTKSNVVTWGQADTTGQSSTGTQPATGYTAIASAEYHTCALHTDGAVTCWGVDVEGSTGAPAGQFSAVTVGEVFSCGVRTDGTITCWGNNDYGQTTAPAGQFSALTAGLWHACGLRNDGTIDCWGANDRNTFRPDKGQTDAPAERFSAVTAGNAHSCGLRTDNSIECWGWNEYGQANAPDGQFSAVSAGGGHSCGLRTDATIACWGINDHGVTNAPAGRFNAIAAGYWHSCGLRTDDTIACWGRNLTGVTDSPAGRFSAVSVAHGYSCALRINGTITCWGGDPLAQTDVRPESAGDPGDGAGDSGSGSADSDEDDGRPEQPGVVGGGSGGSDGESEYSVPSAPTNLLISFVDGESLRIVWRAPIDDGGSAVTGYLVQVSHPRLSSSIGPMQRYFEQQSRSLLIEGVRRGTTYTVSVRAKNRIGTGDYVSERKSTATALGIPTVTVVPEGRSLLTLWVDDADAVAHWDRVAGAEAYDIDWRYMEVDIERLREVYHLLRWADLNNDRRASLSAESATLIEGKEIYSRKFGGDSLPDLSGGVEVRCMVERPRRECHNFVIGGDDSFDTDDPSYRIHSNQPDKLLQVRVRAIGSGASKGTWSEWAYHPTSRFNLVCQFLDIWNKFEDMKTALNVAGIVLTIGSVIAGVFTAGTSVLGAKVGIEAIKFAAKEVTKIMLRSALSRQFIIGLVRDLTGEIVENIALKILGVTFSCLTHGTDLETSDKHSLWEEIVNSLVESGVKVLNRDKVIQSFAFIEVG